MKTEQTLSVPAFVRLRSLIVVAALLLTAGHLAADDLPRAQMTLAPDGRYQPAMDALLLAPDRDALDGGIRRLVRESSDDRKAMIEQLLVFATRADDSVRRRAVAGRIVSALHGEKERVVRALAPQLDNTDGPIRELTRTILADFEDRSATRPPDFSAYRAIIEDDVRTHREPQRSLIEFMFESDAGTAVKALVRAFQLREPADIREILWIEHVVADLMWKRDNGFVERSETPAEVRQEIRKAASHSRWWVRLYAARMIAEYPELSDDATNVALEKDADPSVRRAMPVKNPPR